jgi:hypothetical protein
VTERLWARVAGTDWSGLFNENASLEAFFLIVVQAIKNTGAQVSGLVPTLLARITACLLLAVALGSTFLLRHDHNRRVQLAWIYSFIPVSLATPSASLAYALTNVIPLAICGRFLMVQYRATKYARVALLLVFVGIGLSQFQAVALARLVDDSGPVARLRHPGGAADIVSAWCSVGSFITVLSLAAFQALIAWSTIRGWRRRVRSANGANPAR